jgi:hypothetical protein
LIIADSALSKAFVVLLSFLLLVSPSFACRSALICDATFKVLAHDLPAKANTIRYLQAP